MSYFKKKKIFDYGSRRTFPGTAREAAFLLGGIGTGNVSVGSRGQLKDWELFNSPGKGNKMPYTFFSIWTSRGQEIKTRVLESKIQPPYAKSHGFNSDEVAGLPRFDSSKMKGEYPFVEVEFVDNSLPVKVSLEAFTPFIPLNADDSGVPGAYIRYTVKNISDQEVNVSIVGSLSNVIGFKGFNDFGDIELDSRGKNEFRQKEEFSGLYYTNPEVDSGDLHHGNMALVTTGQNITYKTEWLTGGWWDGIQDFWDDFREDGDLEKESFLSAEESEASPGRKLAVGSIGSRQTLALGQKKEFEFVLSWYFPNRIKGWSEENSCAGDSDNRQLVKNYYSTLWDSSWEVAEYLIDHRTRLEEKSRDFRRALFGSTLPSYVIDALAANITVLRSPTCFRIEDGSFLGWEGCFDRNGCCEGSCTHVWNYTQTLAFLFPKLEQNMRKIQFLLETDEKGKMAFRGSRVFDRESWDMIPAADGQLGSIVRLYRDWKLSGNDKLLREVWDKASSALDFAFDYWDSDGDFVLDDKQHNTYDIEFYGPNSLVNSIFFAALKAGREMADYLEDKEHVEKYQRALKEGSSKMDELLWNGEYYIQNIDDVDKYRYQYGTGCLSDQLLGQQLAHVAGLGYIFPQKHVQKAVHSIFKYNFRDDFSEHHNVQRTYVLNEECGLLLCSWPRGGRPRIPFVYSDEVWTGIEYQVASHLIYEGYIEQGLSIVKAVRDRHDGYKRNPWNEVECGHHYARSMSSWALLIALSGYEYDLPAGKISFDPCIKKDNFSTFWSNGQAWGIYRQQGADEREIEVLYGDLNGVELE